MDYQRELSRLNDNQLEAMACEPPTAFPSELWQALQAERKLRLLPPQVREAAAGAARAPERFESIAGWTVVASMMRDGVSSDDVFEAIGRVLATDELYTAFGQPGYPLDLQVTFPVKDVPGLEALNTTEQIWVRTVSVAPERNNWMGRLLNSPRFFRLAGKGQYVEFSASNRGLFFVRTHSGPSSVRF